jgi:RimJ/RimL family protein N-acetyltransferase
MLELLFPRRTLLQTPRLRLRPLRTRDCDRLIELASDWRIARMMGDLPYPPSRQAMLAWLKPRRDEALFGVQLGRELIGCVGYFGRRARVAEIGFWIAPELWGRGYATEAVERLLRYGFEQRGVVRFTSSHVIDNPASGRVLRRLGFVPTGASEAWVPARKRQVATVVYAIDRPGVRRRPPLAPQRPAAEPRLEAY